MNSLGKGSHVCPHTCAEHLLGSPHLEQARMGQRVGRGTVGAGLHGLGTWGTGAWPAAVSPTLPHLGRVQAPGGAAAGEEPLAAVRECRTAHLQQRPER